MRISAGPKLLNANLFGIETIFGREKPARKQIREEKVRRPRRYGAVLLNQSPGVRRRGWRLEIEFHAELHNARIASCSDLIEETRGHVERGAANRIGVIEGVEGLPAKLAG